MRQLQGKRVETFSLTIENILCYIKTHVKTWYDHWMVVPRAFSVGLALLNTTYHLSLVATLKKMAHYTFRGQISTPFLDATRETSPRSSDRQSTR